MSRMLKPRNATANIAALVGTLLNAGCKLDLGPDIGCVFAFCSGTVIGRVTDAATGQVIPGAQVSGPGHYSSVSATTDANGQYRLDVWAHVDTLYADAADHARRASSSRLSSSQISVGFKHPRTTSSRCWSPQLPAG